MVRRRRSSVLRDDRAVEVIVHADLHGVEVERAGGQGAREVGLAAEAAIEVLALDGPVRSEIRLDARTDGPARVELAVGNSHAERAAAELIDWFQFGLQNEDQLIEMLRRG